MSSIRRNEYEVSSAKPTILWDGVPVVFPVESELVLHADDPLRAPEAVLKDARGREIRRFVSDLEAVVLEQAEADVLARAQVLREQLESLFESGRSALVAHVPKEVTIVNSPEPSASKSSVPTQSYLHSVREALWVFVPTALVVGLLFVPIFNSLKHARARTSEAEARSAVINFVEAQERLFVEENRYASTPEELLQYGFSLDDVHAVRYSLDYPYRYRVSIEGKLGTTCSIGLGGSHSGSMTCER